MMSVPDRPTANQEVSDRVMELRIKIQDKNYIESAVQRIALVLSRNLVENRVPTGK